MTPLVILAVFIGLGVATTFVERHFDLLAVRRDTFEIKRLLNPEDGRMVRISPIEKPGERRTGSPRSRVYAVTFEHPGGIFTRRYVTLGGPRGLIITDTL